MLTNMMSYLKAGVVLSVALTAAFLCIHPSFDLQDGVLRNGFDLDAYPVSTILAWWDCPITGSPAAASENSSAQVARSSDPLDLICVRIC